MEDEARIYETVLGFDSNVLSAFLLANNGKLLQYEGDPLAEERLAAFRLFLYCRPLILPSVTVEAGVIPDGTKLEEHLRFIWHSFAEFIPDELQKQRIALRATELRPFHNGTVDCQVVAEAEVGQVPTLVSLDSTLIARLSPRTRLKLQRPTEFWSALAVPPGMTSKWIPGHGHPLEHESWWRW